MAGGGLYSYDSHQIPCGSELPLASNTWVPYSFPSFNASAAMVILEDKQDNTGMPNDNNCYQPPGKKSRLLPNQIWYLEQGFEVGSKLDPERKIQMAKELELKPKQVAIWFQNRRARSKAKVLEREYETLKASYDELQASYDTLCRENENMKTEVNLLTEKLVHMEIKHDPVVGTCSIEGTTNVAQRQEDASSDVLDSESLCWNYSHSNAAALLMDEAANPWYVFGQEVSDFSQEEYDDHLGRSFQTSSVFPKDGI